MSWRDEPEVDPDEVVWLTPSTRGDVPVHRAEILAAMILRVGVLSSATLIVFGLILALTASTPAAQASRFSAVSVESAYPTSIPALIRGVLTADPVATIALGLLVLILTPSINVVISLVAFAVERDWAFVAISTIILLSLAIGLLLNTTVS